MAKLSFKNGEINTFADKQKLREIFPNRSALQEILTGVLPALMRTLDSNLKSYKQMKNIDEDYYVAKYKGQYYFTFSLYFSHMI